MSRLARGCKRWHPLEPVRRYGKKSSLWVYVSPSISRLTKTYGPFSRLNWEIYIYKEMFRSFIIIDYVSACICITAIQHTLQTSLCVYCYFSSGGLCLWELQREKSDEHTKLCLSSLMEKFRKKEIEYKNWVTGLTGQRETTCHEKRKSADTDLEFSFWFSVVVLTCWSTGFVSTAACMVCCMVYQCSS